MSIFEKITESIYAHTKGETIGNVGIIVADHGNYVIDTSMFPKMARDIRVEVEKLASGKVAGAILTHYHFDHSGGNQHFHDAPIYAHKHVEDNMRKSYFEKDLSAQFAERDDAEKFEGLKVTLPNKVFETNPGRIEDSDQITVYQVGGHTNGSSLIYFAEEKALFMGDNLFAGLYPWGGDPSASPYDWLRAIELARSFSPKLIIPGHGPIQTDTKELVKLQNYLSEIIAEAEALRDEGNPKEDTLQAITEVEFNKEHREGLKEGTLKRWIDVIYE